MLRDIRQFIKERRRLSMQELSVHFKMDQSALEPILEQLEQRGFIKTDYDRKCTGCSKSCAFAGKPMLIIEWADV